MKEKNETKCQCHFHKFARVAWIAFLMGIVIAGLVWVGYEIRVEIDGKKYIVMRSYDKNGVLVDRTSIPMHWEKIDETMPSTHYYGTNWKVDVEKFRVTVE